MSCGCDSGSSYDGGYVNGYNGLCNADTPYPSVSSESVPSLINNLTYALYGQVQKNVTNGQVTWTIPCDPSNIPATINNIPRNAGEGLLCYIIRALNLTTQSGFVTVDGVQTLTNKTFTAPVINTATINNLTATGTLALPVGSVTSAMIAEGTIVNADINASAAIATSKLAPVTSTGSTTARTLENRFADVVNVKDFGAVGDGVTDDKVAIQAAIDSAYAQGGGKVLIPSGVHLLVDSADIQLKDGVVLASDEFSQSYFTPNAYMGGSVLKCGVIILNPSYTLKVVGKGASIKGLCILSKTFYNSTTKGLNTTITAGLATTQANLTGTAITVDGTSLRVDDLYLGHCMILGFNLAASIKWCGRPLIEHIYGDNTSGLYINDVHDIGRAQNCHFWPFLTGADPLLGKRTGIAFECGSGTEWFQISNSYSWGYFCGFKVASPSMRLTNCGCDDNYGASGAGITVGSIGFWVTGTAIDVLLLGCQSACKDTQFLFESTGNGVNQMIGCAGWGNKTYQVSQTASNLVIQNCYFYTNLGSIISASSGITSLLVDGNTFGGGTPFSFSSSALLKITVSTNNVLIGGTLGLNGLSMKKISLLGGEAIYGVNSSHYLRSIRANGTASSPTTVNNGEALGALCWGGYDGSAYKITTAAIRGNVNYTVSSGVIPSSLIFSTEDNAGSFADRIWIAPWGALSPITDNAYTLGASGARWSTVYAATGTINTSDERAKRDIVDSNLGLNFIEALRPVSYKFKVGSNKVIRQVYRDADGNEVDANAAGANPAEILTEEIAGERTHYGLLAQEVKAALPEGTDFGGWILTDKNDPDSQQGLRYDQFISPLIKAVQELSSEVASLKSQISSLTSKP